MKSPDNTISPVRVRMAPSPTGYFHVGSARTALFNWLFARRHNGTFVLRVEDTDIQRNDPAYEQVIYEALAWLGLQDDEGPQTGGAFAPYRQSERTTLYAEHAERLLQTGAAYRAYETPEELAAMKAEQQAQKLPPRYNGAHRDLTPEQRTTFENEGRRPVVRFRAPQEGETSWDDLIREQVTWQNNGLDDFVILKSDGGPAYNFACVVDDAAMQITHVIRGEDGISNTPRQLLLYHALGYTPPRFAHLPLLLGSDRSKLSKRHGPVSLLEFREQGILPQAMFNYLALLGWNPGEGETQEIFTREELIERFSLQNVNKAGAIFDLEKLQWMNTQYLKALPIEEFIRLAQPYLADFVPHLDADDEYSRRALDMARERIHGLPDISAAAAYFFSDVYEMDEKGAAKHLTPEAGKYLEQLHDRLQELDTWNHDAIEGALRSLAEELNIKPAQLIHPARMAVSGRTVGPSVFELLDTLGRERVLRRLKKHN